MTRQFSLLSIAATIAAVQSLVFEHAIAHAARWEGFGFEDGVLIQPVRLVAANVRGSETRERRPILCTDSAVTSLLRRVIS